ncbi:MAG TPA: hypothetical protein VFP39_16390 [Gemmatimonadales bacterium]|nr:hypothetical protein [Gemmatimonadales bacterium]
MHPPNTLIAVGDTVQGHVPPGGGLFRYQFPASANVWYAVFLQTRGSPILLDASDTSGSLPLTSTVADPGLQLLDRATEPFTFGNGPVLLLVDGRDTGTFRLFVYPVDEGPESRPVRFLIGDTVTESLETLADIDTFVVAGSSGQTVVAYAEALNGSSPGILSLGVETLAGVGSAPGDTDLQQASTGRFLLPGTRDYRVTVQSARDFNTGYRQYHGPYRFQLRSIATVPEHHAATVAVGDTVAGESIDYVADVDAFTVSGAPGQECVVFLQGLTGNTASRFALDVLDSSGAVMTNTQSGGADAALLGQMTARFRFPATGPSQMHLRVSGSSDQVLVDRGPYRFWVYPIDRHPETAADTLALGDSILNEPIDVPGDVDEFHVKIPDSTGLNVVVRSGPTSTGGALQATLLDSTGRIVVGLLPLSAGGISQSGAFEIGPGSYTLRVNGFSAYDDGRSPFQGGYQVWVYAFGFAPETAPDTIAIGDTVATETLHPPGDVDTYYFFGTQGQHLNVALAGQGAPGGTISLELDPIPFFFQSPTAGVSLGGNRSTRIDLQTTGWYRVRIGGDGPPGAPLTDAGPYQFAVTAADSLPEHVLRNISIGDTVSAEAIDYFGDYDSYVVSGAPGQVFAAVFQLPAQANYPPVLEVDDAATGAALGSVVGTVTATFTVPVTIPASGHVGLRVREQAFGGIYSYVGGYWFAVQPITLAPENVPATFALGDTVRGEAIAPGGDIDEFTSTATPGVTLAARYRLTANPVPPGSLITLEVVDPATGNVLAGAGASLFGSTPDFFSAGTFVVPPSGSYRVRVRAYDRNLATAPYEFFVAPAP